MTEKAAAVIASPETTAFSRAFRRHAAGVAVITARRSDGTPVGFTATSLSSLSAVPPLVTFNMARTASSWSAIAESDRVIIHLLGAGNRPVANIMSGPMEQRFTGDHWHEGPHGLPVLNDVTSWLVGRIVRRVEIAESAVVIVEIEEGATEDNRDALIYHDRKYHVPGDVV
jgi:flavin reductase (DIM6/NTAB) family NADH-FMN oxidoreductase RutF